MNEIELIENLLESVKKITFNKLDEFKVLEKRTELIIRKLFGDESHYIKEFKNIHFFPSVIISHGSNDWKGSFESGLKQFRDLIQIMMEDKKLSSNYENSKTIKFIKAEHIPDIDKKTLKEIKVLIASPGDVIRERELLLDNLETKFRREHYEERCGARIIVDGWEIMASQTGYPQDIIKSDLVSKANIILAVFRHKLGSSTIDIKTGKDRSQSGTAEELLYAIRNNLLKKPLGMAYFYANAPVFSLDSVGFDEVKTNWERLEKFRDEIKNEILYKSYKYEEEILDITSKDLCENILKYFK